MRPVKAKALNKLFVLLPLQGALFIYIIVTYY